MKEGKSGLIDESTLRERRHVGEEGVLVISHSLDQQRNDHFQIQSYGIHKTALKTTLHQHIGRLIRSSFDGSPRFKQYPEEFLEQHFVIKPDIILTTNRPMMKTIR